MDEGLADPEDFLRSLTAEALLHARPGGPLFPVSLGLMAVANALVMLGLLPEPGAEAVLAEHRLALERKGFGTAWGVTKGVLAHGELVSIQLRPPLGDRGILAHDHAVFPGPRHR